MSAEKRISAYLTLAGQDIDAARLLVEGNNRYAAYHVQQGIEKLLKAVLLAGGKEAGAEHRIEPLLDQLSPGSAWIARLNPFERYSAYATAFRYPTPGGRIPLEPDPAVVEGDVVALGKLLTVAWTELAPEPRR